MTPVASPRPAKSSGPPWELSRQTGPLPAIQADGDPADGDPADGPGADGDLKGLPRRVRQASIAPQLRDNPPLRRTSAAPGAPAGAVPNAGPNAGPNAALASGPTPAEIRRTMSALQRGWQEGRSQRLTGPAPDDPSPGPGTDGGGAVTNGQGTAAGEQRGEPDGA